MSYFTDADAQRIKEQALEDSKRYDNDDDLWSFLHSTLMHIMDHADAKMMRGYDGFYKMKEFDVNGSAEWLETALRTRAEFLQDKASHDHSG